MRDDAFLDWKRERVEIEREMDVLLKAGQRATLEDRRIRQIQFAALIERRNAAMRNLLQSASPKYLSIRSGSWPLTSFPRTAEEIVEQGSELAASQPDEEVVERIESAAPKVAEEIAEQSLEPAAPRAAKETAEQSAEPAAPRTRSVKKIGSEPAPYGAGPSFLPSLG